MSVSTSSSSKEYDYDVDVEAQPAKLVEDSSEGEEQIQDPDEDDPELVPSKTLTNDGTDPFLIDFEKNDQRNPLNWPYKKKWLITVVVSLVTFISPVASSIVAPADYSIVKELNITNSYVSQLTMTIFVLGYAIGPLILSPLSELFGRRWVLIWTNMFFLVFNLACGFAQTPTQLIVCRLFAGIGGSVPQSVGSGTLADMWSSEERGKAYSIYSLAPLLGPALGPIAGGFIAENVSWRWAFWATSIADGVIALFVFIMLQETYAPQLLRDIAVAKRKETGDDRFHTKYEQQDKSVISILTLNLVRPLKFLATQPIIQFVAVYMAFLYGVLYLLLTTFPKLWTEVYHESPGIGGLNYISVSLGCLVAAQVGARLLDIFYRKLKDRNNGLRLPEYRVPLMIISSLIFPSGMFIYGWTAYYHVHWIGPNIGMAVAMLGLVMCFTPLQIYVVDSFGRYAASAMAAVSVLRSLCGFALPLAGPKMYQELGYGWGNSLLGFIAIGLGVPLPIILWYFGQRIRRMSKYAVKT